MSVSNATQLRAVLRALTSFLPITLLLALCACNESAKTSANGGEPLMTGHTAQIEEAVSIASLPAGERMFYQNCGACHDESGRFGPPLVDAAGYFVRAGVGAEDMGKLLFEPVRVKREGSIMPAFSPEELSDQQLMELGAWLAGKTPAPSEPPALGDSTRGAELYANNCAQCHGAQGEGIKDITKVPMAAVVGGLQAHEMSAAAWLGFVMLYSRTGGGSTMPPFTETQLSDSELADIAAFTWDLPPLGPPPAAESTAQPEDAH